MGVGAKLRKKRIFGRTRFSPIGEKKIKASHARGVFFGENVASTRIFLKKCMRVRTVYTQAKKSLAAATTGIWNNREKTNPAAAFA